MEKFIRKLIQFKKIKMLLQIILDYSLIIMNTLISIHFHVFIHLLWYYKSVIFQNKNQLCLYYEKNILNDIYFTY